jgi:nucleosome-remodeling factor subunit BPTF
MTTMATAGQKIITTTTAANANNLAQQLASGKIQLSTVNGQQMLIQTMGSPAAGTMVQNVQTVQAAGGQMKQMMVMPQGQRIVVQNLQGGSLTPQQLLAIQEQLKIQMVARQGQQPGVNNKTPVTIALRAVSVAAAPNSSAAVAVTTTTATAQSRTATISSVTSVRTTPVAAAAVSATTSPSSPAKGGAGGDQQFVVTQDFIQQTIRKALKQENLNPEIEQKLLLLQRFQEAQKKDDGDSSASVATPFTVARKRTSSSNEDFASHLTTTPVTPRPVARKALNSGTPVTSTASEELREQRNRERSMKAQQRNKERRFQNAQARLQGVLNKQAELLKKEIMRKRALLEKELRQSINKELAALLPTSLPPAATTTKRPHPASAATSQVTPPSAIKKEKIIKTEKNQTPAKVLKLRV